MAKRLAAVGLGLILAATTTAASAQVLTRSSPVNARAPMSQAQVAQILKTAKPMRKTIPQRGAAPAQIGVAGKGGAAPVTVAGDPGPSGLGAGAPQQASADGPSGLNYGSGNLNTVFHYSDYNVTTPVMRTHPYRTTGFFLFQQNGSWFYCTGALIARSLLLTAGHCVHDGSNSHNGWTTDGYFYPAGSGLNSSAPVTPYGFARFHSASTWTAWFQSPALGVGNDVGIVVLHKRDGTTREMGYYTGTMGFCVTGCRQNFWFLSQLGYPGNYSGGNVLYASQHLATIGTNWGSFATGDIAYGTGMEGGSSGGPLVANIGSVVDSAADKGQWTFRNIIFAPNSWGYPGANLKVGGGSPLSQAGGSQGFKPLYNSACSTARSLHGTGACTPL